MSVKVMARVWDAGLAPNHKLVLLAYADAANDDGTKSYPGEERVATMTGYSVSQIRRVTRELIEAGHLARVKRGYRGQRAEFAVTLKGAQSATHSNGESLANDAEKPSAHATPPVLTRPTSPNGDGPSLFEAFFEAWVGKPYSKGVLMPKSMRSRLNAGVKEALEAGIGADDVTERAKRYRRAWPDIECSPQGLLGNWALFDGDREPEPFDPAKCDHPPHRVTPVDDAWYCGLCSRELESA